MTANRTKQALLLGATLSASMLTAAQDPGASTTLEEVVVTGTRVEGKSPTETLSPLDVLGGAELSQQASFDLTSVLSNISPSINTLRFPIADGTALIRPVNLRGLAPDQTLVLVNGSRRHRSALVNLVAEPFGTVNQGAQAVDFGLIPAIAIKQIEVLRDGASAQYGSDAIAGVINVILREDSDGLDFTSQYGQYGRGDGESLHVAGNAGLRLGDSGFLNVSAEYISSDITSRGSGRPDAAAAAALVGRQQVPFDGLGQRWGDPELEGVRVFVNSAFDLSAHATMYAHGSFAEQEGRSGFFYRTPFGVPGVQPRSTLCACDANGNPLPTPQSIVDGIIAQGLDPADYLTASASSPSGWASLNPIHTQFAGGYNPTFGADITDYSIATGVKGESNGGLHWDISGRLGQNEIDYVLENSINPGLGRRSPLNFRPGELQQREVGINADFVYRWETGALAAPVNVAFGVEYRREIYEIGAGDRASYESGPAAALFGVGSDGFQGDSPAAAGDFSQRSYAGYLDLETDLTDRLSVGVAGRLEDFESFGRTFDWKVSARVEATDWLAFRGTINTGFRAPTPGQINTLDVTTTLDPAGNLIPIGTFPVNSIVATTLGARPLDAEESFNVTAGLVLTPAERFSLTLDLYQIDVDKRIALVGRSITPGSAEDQALAAAGFPGLGQASFFVNAFDTTVRGIDLTAVTQLGNVTLDLRHSWNEQEVDRVLGNAIDAERVFDLENQLPNHRSVLTASYDAGGRLGGFIRFNHYGAWDDFTFGERAAFGSKLLVDLEAKLRVSDNIDVSLGGQNVFDTLPDRETNSVLTFVGATRPLSSPFGFNGAFWYLRVQANW